MSEAERLPPHEMTVDEFLDWAADAPGRWQLREGEPEMMAPASDRHGAIQGELAAAIITHLRQTGSRCRLSIAPGVIPYLRSDRNMLVPDIGISCTPASASVEMLDPVVLIEILSPRNARATRANVWSYATIPSVREIILVRRALIGAEIYRRLPDGSWPPSPDMIAADGMLRIASIGFEMPLRDAYRTAGTIGVEPF